MHSSLRLSAASAVHPFFAPAVAASRLRGLAAAARRRRSLALLSLPPALAVAGVVLFQLLVLFWEYPDAAALAAEAASPVVVDRHGTPLAAFVSADEQWRMPLTDEQISEHLKRAIVAVEDARFESHGGVDWLAAGSAAWQNLSRGRIHRGASTLTMQVHRMRHPQPRSFWWKFEQAVRACQIERELTKRQILTEYLNRAPFGANLVGAGAASWRYFGKPCAELSLAEAALLAGLPQNPQRLRPDRYPEAAARRRDHVLDRMHELGMISSAELAEARAEPVSAAWRPLPQRQANGALPVLINLADQHRQGRIVTTLDAAVQQQAAEAAWQALLGFGPDGPDAVAVVVLDTATAECLANLSLARDGTLIDLSRRPRSSGSVLKPFIYAAAFEAGIAAPRSLLEDVPSTWAGYAPGNYDRDHRGWIQSADALAESRNIPAIALLAELDSARIAALMGSAGMRTLARRPQRYGLSLAIGGAEVTPMELAEAYATLARGGVHRPVSEIFDVRFAAHACTNAKTPRREDSREGCFELLWSRWPSRHRGFAVSQFAPAQSQIATTSSVASRVLMEEACWKTMAALSERWRTDAISPAAGAAGVAWKTGTSSGHRDAWCAAATRNRTVVVWMGNLDGRGDRKLVGATAAAPLALGLLAALDPDGEAWPQPADVDPPARGRVHRLTERTLRLVQPADAAEFVLDSSLSPQEQRIAFQAGGPSTEPGQRVWWFVNGQLIGESGEGEVFWWTGARGQHEVRASDAAGRSAQARIAVR